MSRNKYKISIILIIFLFFIPSVYAWSEMPITYYNNWNSSEIISNLELNISNPDKYPYKILEDNNYYYLYKNNDSLNLSKAIIDEIHFKPTKINFNITTTKGTISNKSTANGTGMRYISIPNSLLKTRFLFDDALPEVLINNGTHQWYADPTTYWYSKVNGQTRFNFMTAPYTSLNTTDKIIFIFSSWVVDNAIVSGLTDVGGRSYPTVFTIGAIQYLISGNSTGDFTGFNWTGSTWQKDNNIVSGLPNLIEQSAPTTFINNSILYLIAGNVTGPFTGFNWTGSTWQKDNTIVSGLLTTNKG